MGAVGKLISPWDMIGQCIGEIGKYGRLISTCICICELWFASEVQGVLVLLIVGWWLKSYTVLCSYEVSVSI